MNADQIWGIVRTLLAAGGGFLVAKGFVDDATLASILGALGVLFTAGWSIYQKHAASKATTAAITAAVAAAK